MFETKQIFKIKTAMISNVQDEIRILRYIWKDVTYYFSEKLTKCHNQHVRNFHDLLKYKDKNS